VGTSPRRRVRHLGHRRLRPCLPVVAVKDGWSFGSFDTVMSFTSLGTGAYPACRINALNGDSVTQMVPFNTFDWTAIHHLQFPLWNDLSLLGLNQFLNFQSAVLSLPDVVSYLFPLRFAFLVVVAMKLLIAGPVLTSFAACSACDLWPRRSAGSSSCSRARSPPGLPGRCQGSWPGSAGSWRLRF